MSVQPRLDDVLQAVAKAAARAQRASVYDDELDRALETVIPRTNAAGWTLAQLVENNEIAWIEWALQRPVGYWPEEVDEAVSIVAIAYFPRVWAAAVVGRAA